MEEIASTYDDKPCPVCKKTGEMVAPFACPHEICKPCALVRRCKDGQVTTPQCPTCKAFKSRTWRQRYGLPPASPSRAKKNKATSDDAKKNALLAAAIKPSNLFTLQSPLKCLLCPDHATAEPLSTIHQVYAHLNKGHNMGEQAVERIFAQDGAGVFSQM
jgi:hypothetical protein